MRRFRQIVAAIRRRQFLRRREDIAIASWQTRNISAFIAAGYMVEKGKPNTALDSASVLAFDEIEAAQIEEAQKAGANSSVNPGNKPMFDENGDIIPLFPEPKEMSFERFESSFGNPFQWAGR